MHRNYRVKWGVFAGAVALVGAALSLALADEVKSGVAKGEMLSAYHPTHVTGPDKNTDTCPVCKYPFNPGVQVWVNDDSAQNVEKIVSVLEKAATKHADKKLKAFVVFINPKAEPSSAMKTRLASLAEKEKVANVSLVYLPGPKNEAVSEYQINTDPKVKNTIFVYKARKVDTKFVNFVADENGIKSLKSAIKNVL
jgi:protocatechuate 3,4-dioxygenase beta subunit